MELRSSGEGEGPSDRRSSVREDIKTTETKGSTCIRAHREEICFGEGVCRTGEIVGGGQGGVGS